MPEPHPLVGNDGFHVVELCLPVDSDTILLAGNHQHTSRGGLRLLWPFVHEDTKRCLDRVAEGTVVDDIRNNAADDCAPQSNKIGVSDNQREQYWSYRSRLLRMNHKTRIRASIDDDSEVWPLDQHAAGANCYIVQYHLEYDAAIEFDGVVDRAAGMVVRTF